MNGPAEIRDLQISFHVEEKVLWLDVSVNDVLFVEVFEARDQARHKEACEIKETNGQFR